MIVLAAGKQVAVIVNYSGGHTINWPRVNEFQ
jgi:hypothetical protein